MHQDHNIPWNTLASNFKFFRENPHITPHRTDLCPLNKPTQAGDFTHFVKALKKTIQMFAVTERAKYPSTFPAPSEGNLFSDELLKRYRYSDPTSPYWQFSLLDIDNQRIEYWISRVRPANQANEQPAFLYDTNLGDVVKLLIVQNEMDTLLMLANHPKIPINCLHSMSHGHSFGWDRLQEYALQAYIFFNVIASKPELMEGGKYKEMESYEYVVNHLTASCDGDAQTIPHREFLLQPVAGNTRQEELDRAMNKPPIKTHGFIEVFEDLELLQEYLKKLFSLLYRYDMLARECGLDPKWELNISNAMWRLWRTKAIFLPGQLCEPTQN